MERLGIDTVKIVWYSCYTVSDNKFQYDEQINVRLSKWYLDKLKPYRNRSEAIRKGLDLLFHRSPKAVTLESLDEKIDSRFDELAGLIKEEKAK